MAARMKHLGAMAVVVTGAGRVRDVTELNSLGLPVDSYPSVSNMFLWLQSDLGPNNLDGGHKCRSQALCH